MQITENILCAIKKAVENAGNPYRFSQSLEGIRHTTVRDWLSGKVKSISDGNWEKLYPRISRWLPARKTSKDHAIILSHELLELGKKIEACDDYPNNKELDDLVSEYIAIRNFLRDTLKWYVDQMDAQMLKGAFEYIKEKCDDLQSPSADDLYGTDEEIFGKENIEIWRKENSK